MQNDRPGSGWPASQLAVPFDRYALGNKVFDETVHAGKHPGVSRGRMPMTGNQDLLASGRDDVRLLLWDLACISGTLSEIATVWRRARPYLPELPALVPEQLADAARHLASVIESLANVGLLKLYAQAASLVEQSSALQQGIASAQAMTCGDGVPDLGDARLWESLRGPVRRAGRQITELVPELVTPAD
jgi:hypothetical protein